jgi:hypothetical protein
MADDSKTPELKVTDRRHFDLSGEKRKASDVSPDPEPPRVEKAPEPKASKPAGEPSKTAAEAPSPRPPEPPSSGPSAGGAPTAENDPPGDMSEITANLSSSFSLLVARLAQETEIYLGLVPYPGKETSEPDLEAARAMIDLLSMLQTKTRGNLEAEEARLLENLLYTYRLEYVRLKPDVGAR